jgi:hypothetical protein
MSAEAQKVPMIENPGSVAEFLRMFNGTRNRMAELDVLASPTTMFSLFHVVEKDDANGAYELIILGRWVRNTQFILSVG